jgi:hypothetical protein
LTLPVNLTTLFRWAAILDRISRRISRCGGVEVAAREFGLANATLRKALNKSGAIADEHGCFSTRQLIGAVFGALELEQLRTQEQITRKYLLDNANR